MRKDEMMTLAGGGRMMSIVLEISRRVMIDSRLNGAAELLVADARLADMARWLGRFFGHTVAD